MPTALGVLLTDGWAGRQQQLVEVIAETPKRYRIRALKETRLAGRQRWLQAGETALVPRHAVSFSPTLLAVVKEGLTAYLTPNDPEPPLGTRVRDANGTIWQNVAQPLGGTYWLQVEHPDYDPESWLKVAGNYGPVRVVGELLA